MVRAPVVSRSVHVTMDYEIINRKKISGTSGGCGSAFRTPDQTFQQVACQVENVCAQSWLFPKKNARYLNH